MLKYVVITAVSLSVPFVTFGYDSMAPEVRIFNKQFEQTASFNALNGSFDGGLDVAVGDVDGDGVDEIVIGAGRSGGPMVQVFEGDGTLVSQWFAYGESLRTGIQVTTGDLNGDGTDEIVTGVGAGGGPQVRVFNKTGKALFGNGFFAFDKDFRGGVNVTVGDFNGDGKAEIATAAGPGGAPHVRVFTRKGRFLGTEFRPFAEDNTGGVALATANVDGGDDDELIMAIQSAGEDWIKTYKNDGTILGEWKNFDGLYSGLSIGAGDIDKDGFDEIAVTPRQSAGPHVLWYEGHGDYTTENFFAYPEDFRGGLNIATGDINGDDQLDIVTVPGKNRAQGRTDLVRYIDVDLSEQTTRVYEYGEEVREFLISSGVSKYPTETGEFEVERKIYNKDYKWSYGENHPDNYDIKNVKWNLLFNEGGRQYLHYAYWHNNFGNRMSHGCVNINAENAEWLYNWAVVGDPVIVHD